MLFVGRGVVSSEIVVDVYPGWRFGGNSASRFKVVLAIIAV